MDSLSRGRHGRGTVAERSPRLLKGVDPPGRGLSWLADIHGVSAGSAFSHLPGGGLAFWLEPGVRLLALAGGTVGPHLRHALGTCWDSSELPKGPPFFLAACWTLATCA